MTGKARPRRRPQPCFQVAVEAVRFRVWAGFRTRGCSAAAGGRSAGTAVTLSIWVGIFGVLAGALASGCFRDRLGKPERYWLVGLAATAPAWIIALTVLLGGLSGENPDKGMKALLALSTAGGLLGVIATEFCVRWLKARPAEAPGAVYWLLGTAALMPSWGFMLWRVP